MFALLLVITSAWTWSPDPRDPNTLRLWNDASGRWALAGEYDTSTGVYREWDGRLGRCHRPAEPPAPLPAAHNFGVDTSQLRTSLTPRYRLCGFPVNREVALKAIEDKKVPDRSTQRWITACGGSEGQRKQLLDALPQDVKAASRVQSYPHNHWALRPGFACKADVPTLYVQRPDGGVIHRHEGVEITPQLISALREPSPKWDPSKAPDLSKSWPLTGLPKVPPPVGAAGIVIAGMALLGNSSSPRSKKG